MTTSRYKVVFVGDMSVGKTSIVLRFIGNKFTDIYNLTVGVDFFTKTIVYKGKSIKLQIWDSAGQEKYKALIPSYVRGASIIFLVYDVTRKETFLNIKSWLDFIRNIKFENSIIVLCGNKIDVDKQVSYEEGENFAKKENLMFFEVSAKTLNNLNNMFYSVVAELNFFNQYNIEKHKIIVELDEENKNSKEGDKIPEDIIGMLENIENKKNASCKC